MALGAVKNLKKPAIIIVLVSVVLSVFIILNFSGVFAKKTKLDFAVKCNLIVKGMDEDGEIRPYVHELSGDDLATLQKALSGHRIFNGSRSNCYEYYTLTFTGNKKSFTVHIEDNGMSTMKCDTGYFMLTEDKKQTLYSVIYPYF